MKVSGITLAREAVSNGYPVVECVRSLLLACDEVVVNIGDSADGTREAVLGIGSPRVKLLESPWDMNLREKGLVLSQETNRAMRACGGDWVLYLQADEIMHEDDGAALRPLLERLAAEKSVDGVSFRYLHFYGTAGYFQDHFLKWYTRAVRAVRNDGSIVSVGDALKFRKKRDGTTSRLREFRSPLRVFHYGWARRPEIMLRKQKHLDRFWHDDDSLKKKYASASSGGIYSDLGNLMRFEGSHPSVMQEWIGANAWDFDPRIGKQPPRWVRLLLMVFIHPLNKARIRLWRSSAKSR